MKYLIINADDFGYSEIFNEEILSLLEKEFITSTTVMVDEITENQQKQILKLIKITEKKNQSIGLHLDLKNINFKEEIERQYKLFFSIFKKNPSHLDLHKWSYLEVSYPFILDFCKEHNLPCRKSKIESKGVLSTYMEVISTTNNTFEEIINKITFLEEEKTYEILFHPGKYDSNCKSSYNKQREVDVENIGKLNQILEKNDIKLISYLQREYLLK
jgi:predicted glycoside hydrolase/deacetylase ChbG (UPF0249 family)